MSVLILVILIAVNAFFASSEIAFISLSQYKLEKESKNKTKKGRKAKKIINLTKNPSKFLSLIQVGVTLAGFLASAMASSNFADDLSNMLIRLLPNVSSSILYNCSLVFITLLLSLTTLIFGELVPKRIAMNCSEKLAYATVDILYILSKIFGVVIAFLTAATDLVTKILKIPTKKEEGILEETLLELILEARNTGKIELNEGKILSRVFKMNDTKVYEIMTKYKDVVAIDEKASAKDALKLIEETKFTRIPVYSKDKKNIVGLIHIKDILLNLNKEKKDFKIAKIVRKINKLKENAIIDDAFMLLNKTQVHIAVIENEEGKMQGIVTLEDILEELVGEIYDYYDKI